MTVIDARGLSHTYTDGSNALCDLSFTVQQGESVALVGPNGAGKTTLFLRLAGVLNGLPGQASICGLDPALKTDRKKLPQTVGIVFQNTDDQLFSPTVFEDVAFGPLNLGLTGEEVTQRVRDSLAAVNLHGFEERNPHRLSGGEKRRAAIATVLAMHPSVLLFDEPTQDLDPRSRRELIATITALSGTKLVATHDLDFVLEVCERVVMLENGRLFADGKVKTILADATLLGTHGFEVPYRLRK